MYRITITDLENGEDIVNSDTSAIIAAVYADGKGADASVLVEGSPMGAVCTVMCAERAIKALYKERPELAAVATLLKAKGDLAFKEKEGALQ